MNFNEYKAKKQKNNEEALNFLADDLEETTVYTLHWHDRDTGLILFCGIFRRFSNLKKAIEYKKEFEKMADDEAYCVADFQWFKIKKYIMVDDEFEECMSIDIDFDNNVIHYSYIQTNLKAERIALLEAERIALDKIVTAPYETGDIIIVRAMPMSSDYYAIYIYDERQEGNKHIQMTFEDGVDFREHYWLEKTEKAQNSPNDKLNEISRRIKEEKGNFRKVFQEMDIILPF